MVPPEVIEAPSGVTLTGGGEPEVEAVVAEVLLVETLVVDVEAL